MEVTKLRPSERFTEITGQTGLYNIQAIDNVPSIMQRGLLSNERASRINHVSIAMNEVQVRRELVRVPSQNEEICILKFDRSVLDFGGNRI